MLSQDDSHPLSTDTCYFEMVFMTTRYLTSGFHNFTAKPPTFLSLSRTTLTSGRAGVSEKSARNR